MEVNKVYNEPCLETLKKMEDKSIDCVITSPPYWQLRDYGYEGQWGLEPTFQEYLAHLWEMMDEIYRVLKDEGTCWINLGDTYARGTRAKYAHSNQSLRSKHEQLIEPNTKPNYEGLDKCLLLIPHRFAIGCIDRGWVVRNDIIWAKRNGMPESVTDRFTKKHEYIFFMVKSEKYYFDLDAIRDRVKDESLKRYEYDFSGNKGGIDRDLIGYTEGNKKHLLGEKPQYSVLDASFRNPIIEQRDLPKQEELRLYLSNARKTKGITIQEIENIFENQAPHHWFEKNGSYPSKEDWIKLKEILEFDERYDEMMTSVELKSGMKQNNPKGKNPGSVSDFWDITTKPSSNKHYAAYNDELIRKPILAGCPEFICNKCGKPRETIYEYEEVIVCEKEFSQKYKDSGVNSAGGRATYITEKLKNQPDKIKIAHYLKLNKGEYTYSSLDEIFGYKDTISHWFRTDSGFSLPSPSDWKRLKEILKFDDTYDKIMTETVKVIVDDSGFKGKNIGLSDCGCKAGFSSGIVYDPFMGTGSTAEASLRANRNFIGSEMSEEYIKICNQRLSPILNQLTLF